MKAMAIMALCLLVLMGTGRAMEMNICEIAGSGYEYGMHIMMHAQEGMLGRDMNPGQMHQGYSQCVP